MVCAQQTWLWEGVVQRTPLKRWSTDVWNGNPVAIRLTYILAVVVTLDNHPACRASAHRRRRNWRGLSRKLATHQLPRIDSRVRRRIIPKLGTFYVGGLNENLVASLLKPVSRRVPSMLDQMTAFADRSLKSWNDTPMGREGR